MKRIKSPAMFVEEFGWAIKPWEVIQGPVDLHNKGQLCGKTFHNVKMCYGSKYIIVWNWATATWPVLIEELVNNIGSIWNVTKQKIKTHVINGTLWKIIHDDML